MYIFLDPGPTQGIGQSRRLSRAASREARVHCSVASRTSELRGRSESEDRHCNVGSMTGPGSCNAYRCTLSDRVGDREKGEGDAKGDGWLHLDVEVGYYYSDN